MNLIESLETKASELHCDGDMDGSGLFASAASALRAAEKMAEAGERLSGFPKCARAQGLWAVALKAWNEATK